MEMAFNAACCQFSPEKARVSANLDRIAELSLQASSEGVDLALFPEGAVTGYFLEGGVLESALSAEQLYAELSARCGGLVRPLDVCLGFYELAGSNVYNSAAYLTLGPDPRLLHVYRKFFLPTYGVFDEERFVSRGKELGVFDTRLGRLGILICEDVWHSMLPALCAVRGAQCLLVPSASPGRDLTGRLPANLERYDRLLRAVSEEHCVYCVNAMLCGFEGGKGFAGGSLMTDPFGNELGRGPLHEEHILMASIDLELCAIARAQSPLISDLQSAWADLVRIVNGCSPPETP